MTKTLREVMTDNPTTLPSTATIVDAAKTMREKNIGDVIVMNDGEICGIVTDRDIVVRAVAKGGDGAAMKIGDICSKDVTTLEPDTNVGAAIQLMRDKALRRVPVVENGKPVGIVSLGDLAKERDPKSALADISEAPPNK
jgi:CBS domain-containing protein